MSEAVSAWSWRHAINRSDLQATTKHVLIVLSCWMNEHGGGCYPSISDLVGATSRDKKTVLKHLEVARDAGWIVVSNHGLRGRKWKRNEYSARWPERDLTAPATSLDDDDEGREAPEGGGATPPPQANEVVESCPRGGGATPPDVVEPLHHVYNQSSNQSNTSPVERERASADANGRGVGEVERTDRKAVERQFFVLIKGWPGSQGMPTDRAMKLWIALSPQDREAALAGRDGWFAVLRSQKKSHFPAPLTYIRERLWEAVPAPEEVAQEALSAPPFGPLWAAVRLSRLIRQPECDDKGFPLDGFPSKVLFIDSMAGRGARLVAHPGSDVAGWPELAERMVAVPVGGERWAQWRDEFQRRGWPWLPDPGQQAAVYFPRDLAAFERAVRGADGASEAAE